MQKRLSEEHISKNPFRQFNLWMEEVLKSDIIEPTAMSLATANKNSVPSVRTVLWKGIQDNAFLFYTNYLSRKGKDLIENPVAELLFYFREFGRQIRISGEVERLSREKSKEYFSSRPRESQIGALISEQSQEIPDFNYLMQKFYETQKKYANMEIPLPLNWGGFKLVPNRFEFWQSGEFRLHDRIVYEKKGNDWRIFRLAP